MARNYEELIRRHRKRKTIGFIAAIVLFAGAISGTVAGFTSNAQNTDPIEITAEPTKALIESAIVTEPLILSAPPQKQTGDIKGSPEVIGEPDPAYSLSGEDRDLLVRLAMAEAEGEPTEGKALVMLVVLNRIDDWRFPNTVSGVIYDEGQFSPVSNGRFDRVEPDDDCYEALRLVLDGWNESKGALYFRTTVPEPTWHSRNLKELFTCGSHTFYTEKD